MDLRGKPFYLDPQGEKWVMDTLASMTQAEKIGQLFCLMQRKDEDWRQEADEVLSYRPGGTMFRPLKAEQAREIAAYYQQHSRVPLLISANLERGGSGIVKEGTNYACNMQVAATRDTEMARRQAVIGAREARAVGGNWAFAPVIDIDRNFRNPITNTRTYGDDAELVARMGETFTKAVQEAGLAACIKHFPGDGMDERDQHLAPTINSMSCEEWDATYGMAYRRCIDAGALTVMPGHILQPAYSRKLRPGIKDEDILPATLAPELLGDLLRGKLGFNGLIVTDATTMLGMMESLPRDKAVPQTIAAGCDMFLFSRNLEEDHGYMVKGVEDGTISQSRLDEAVTRVLALKAALHLQGGQAERALAPSAEALKVIHCDEHVGWTRECADRAVTLVKSDGTLPLRKRATGRILLYVIGDADGFQDIVGGNAPYFRQKLEDEGFLVDLFKPDQARELRLRRIDECVARYDYVVYFCALSTKSNQSTVRIKWADPIGANCTMFIPSIPTIFISMENPYHLLDVPRVKTYINAYTNSPECVDAVVEKLMGRSAFMGVSPVDPFCGKWDTHL